MTNDIENFFHVLIEILCILLREIPIQILYPFFYYFYLFIWPHQVIVVACGI